MSTQTTTTKPAAKRTPTLSPDHGAVLRAIERYRGMPLTAVELHAELRFEQRRVRHILKDLVDQDIIKSKQGSRNLLHYWRDPPGDD
jgi:DNA-binding MarR family transcriptional regulator